MNANRRELRDPFAIFTFIYGQFGSGDCDLRLRSYGQSDGGAADRDALPRMWGPGVAGARGERAGADTAWAAEPGHDRRRGVRLSNESNRPVRDYVRSARHGDSRRGVDA